jgi:hypothetical protein
VGIGGTGRGRGESPPGAGRAGTGLAGGVGGFGLSAMVRITLVDGIDCRRAAGRRDARAHTLPATLRLCKARARSEHRLL